MDQCPAAVSPLTDEEIDSLRKWLAVGNALTEALGLSVTATLRFVKDPDLTAEPGVATAPPAVIEPFEPASDVDPIGPGAPDTPTLEEDREALSESDRQTSINMIKAMTPDDRKKFTVEFRDHFNVPRESKTISPHFLQVMHQKFLQNFLDELELSGV